LAKLCPESIFRKWRRYHLLAVPILLLFIAFFALLKLPGSLLYTALISFVVFSVCKKLWDQQHFNDDQQIMLEVCDQPRGIFKFLSSEVALGLDGLRAYRCLFSWEQLEEYRWFKNRSGLIFVTNRAAFTSPLIPIVVPSDRTHEVALFLEEKMPGKRREDVETALEQLESNGESSDAPHSTT
jgi:hypothetical protein